MSKLTQLEMKYAAGGRVSTPHALSAVRRAIAHVERGDHKAARDELTRSPDAMRHPHVQAALGMLAPPGMADGGSVDRPYGQSSPGSPGVLGAIHDAVSALRDYVIERPKREQQAKREEFENQYIDKGQADNNYAEGGKVSAVKGMAKFMIDRLGIPDADAHRLAREYHASAPGGVSPVAKQLADDLVARSSATARTAKKPPQQLAKELAAGFVDPAELNHLLYTDPALTPLIGRYQGGIDNQNLTPDQKQALIRKLQSMGPTAGPQVPQMATPPPQAQMGPPGQIPPPGGAQMPPSQPPPAAVGASGQLSDRSVDGVLQGFRQ